MKKFISDIERSRRFNIAPLIGWAIAAALAGGNLFGTPGAAW